MERYVDSAAAAQERRADEFGRANALHFLDELNTRLALSETRERLDTAKRAAALKAINQAHGVDTRHCRDGGKVVKFLPPATKSAADPWPPVFEKSVRQRYGQNIPRWVVATLWRRERYVAWLAGLRAAGLLPAAV